jgi:hypothetical protein
MSWDPLPVPGEPIALDEVVRLYPVLRQSLLAKLDDCPLSAFFELRYSQGWGTHPQARGTLFHRFAAECLRTMRKQEYETIPVAEALEILYEVVRQRNVPPEDIVRAPLWAMKDLRMAAIKFAKDNRFTTSRLIDVERRFEHPLTYDSDAGPVTRLLSGQVDALLFDPPSGAIVLDWKDTWGLPPEPEDAPETAEDELKGISYHGYFQQRFYGWLVMREFPNVQQVTLREFYVRKTIVRKATLSRDDLEHVERELAVLAEAFDRTMMDGAPPRPFQLATIGRWHPQPGRHCGFCAATRECPIEEDARIEVGAPPASVASAERIGAELEVVNEVRARLIRSAKAWVETCGRPIKVRWSKGRRVLGWRVTTRGRRFQSYTPDASDRGTHTADAQLQDAMKEATRRARGRRRRRGNSDRKTVA